MSEVALGGNPEAGAVAATIVITNHNYDRFLTDAVESAVAQTVPCQVIVVDDGSTDRSAAVLNELALRFPEIEVIRNDNGGQASAMNAGWAITTAQYLLFLDADDRLVPEAAAEVVARFEAEGEADKCLFRLQWIDADGNPIAGQFPEVGQQLPAGDLRDRVLRNPDDIPWQPTTGNAFRRDALARFMPIPEPPYRLSADHYLSNLSALTGPVAAIETVLGHYRVHGENADHRVGFDVARIRSILIRTQETRRQLITYGRALGLTTPSDPDGFVSLTNAAARLTSYRLGEIDGDTHPIDGDRLVPLMKSGIGAALAREDLPLTRRAMAVAWIAALTVAPKALVKNVAAKGLTR